MSKYKGFTLIEMMVVLAIFSMVMGIAYTTLRLNDTYRDLVLIKIQLYRQNKKALESISAELQRSTNNSVTITDSNPDSIRFQIPLINSIDAQYNIPWGARQGNTDYPNYFINYRLNGANLVREVLKNDLTLELGTDTIIAENIVALQISSISANYIRINITSQRMTVAPQRPISAASESTVYLRN